MGGRIYDPTLGRFLQADPFIQAPTNSQNYNRYSYVLNNPMSYTDPSGYLFKALGNVFKKALRAIAKVPILNLGAQAAACYFGGPWGCAAYASASTYAVTGSLGAAFTSGFVSLITPGGGSFGNIATTAVIGGLASKAQGGNFGHGFWSAGLGAGLGGRIKLGNAYLNVIAAAVLGGTVSKLTGGKFSNGAQTWAFSAAMAQDWSTSGSASSDTQATKSYECVSGCGKAYLGDISGQSAEWLWDTRSDLLEARGQGYDAASINSAISRINKEMMYALSTKVNTQSIMMEYIAREYRSTQTTVANYMYITAKYGSVIFGIGVASNISSVELLYNIANDGFTIKNKVGVAYEAYSTAFDIATKHPGIEAINYTVSEIVDNLPWEDE